MTRRLFCHRLGLVGAAAFLAPAAVTSAAVQLTDRRFRLCLNPGAIGVRADQGEAMALARAHGFEAVEPMPGALARLGAGELDTLLGELRDGGLVWGAAGLPVNFRGTDAQFETDLKALAPACAALERAGVQRVGTWISPAHPELTFLSNFRLHELRLRETARVLGDHGLRLGLEYVGTHTLLIGRKYPFIHTLAETRDLLAAIGRDNVGVVLDSWHWWQAEDTEADLLSLRNEEVVAVDLNDAPAGRDKREQRDGERELPAATGVIDLRVFLGALVKIGYDGPVRAEPFNRPLNEMENDPACAATIAALRRAVDTLSSH
jgi:sugar phosphate isomerase/epimerase